MALTATYDFPAGQGAQLGSPATDPKPGVMMPTNPMGQHVPQPSAEAKVPAGHITQSLGAVAPAVAAKRPAAQGVQAVAPVPPAS